MRFGLPTCEHANEPNALYMRLMYHEWSFGPFADEAALSKAINHLDETEPWWDYDCFEIIGLSSDGMMSRIEAKRMPLHQRPQPKVLEVSK